MATEVTRSARCLVDLYDTAIASPKDRHEILGCVRSLLFDVEREFVALAGGEEGSEGGSMSRPVVDEILATIEEKGGTIYGTEREMFDRFADLGPSSLLAAVFKRGVADLIIHLDPEHHEWLYAIETFATTILAMRLEPDAERKAIALYDPEFTFSDPQPVTA